MGWCKVCEVGLGTRAGEEKRRVRIGQIYCGGMLPVLKAEGGLVRQ